MRDCKGNILHDGDTVHNKWGYDMTIHKVNNGHWYGYVKTKGLEGIRYAVYSEEITKI